MKYLAGYLQHQNQHSESLLLYQSVCQVRHKNLQESEDNFVTDQINHGAAMIKAYKYRLEQPDSTRMLTPPKDLLETAVRCIHVILLLC